MKTLPFHPRRLWTALFGVVVAALLFYAGYHPVAHLQLGSERAAWVWLDAPALHEKAPQSGEFSGWVHVPRSGTIWLENSIGADVTLTVDGTEVYTGFDSREIRLSQSGAVRFNLRYTMPETIPPRGILALQQETILGTKQPIPPWNYTRTGSPWLSDAVRLLALLMMGAALALVFLSLRLTRRQWLIIALIFALSLSLRLIVMAEKFANDDSLWTMETVWDNYVVIGRSWVAGLTPIGGNIFQQGMFIYWGLIQMVLGPHLANLIALNTVLGSLVPVLLLLAGWALVNRQTGIIAGLIAALFAPLIHFQGTLQIVAPGILLVSVLLAAAAALYRWPHPVFAIVSGSSVGLATTFRSTLLFMLALPVLVLLLTPLTWRKRIIYGALVVAFAALCISPVTISNIRAGEYVLTASLMDYQLFRSNNIDSMGFNTYRTQSEQIALARHESWTGALRRDIERDPGRLVELTIRRVALFWEPEEHSDSGMIDYKQTGIAVSPTLKALSISQQSNFRLLMVLALFGLGVGLSEARTRRVTLLLGAALLLYMASLSFFYVIARVRAPLTGIVILLAALGLGALPRLRRESTRQKGTALALFAVSVLLAGSFNYLADNLPRPAFVSKDDLPATLVKNRAVYGDQLELLGYAYYDSSYEAGGFLTFELFWQALRHPSDDYVLAVRLVNNDTQAIEDTQNFLLGTQNEPDRTTSQWDKGQIFDERYLLELPQQGVSYDIYVGVYDQDDAQMLPVQNASDDVRDNHLRLTAVGLRQEPPADPQGEALLVWEKALALQKLDCSITDQTLRLDFEWYTLKRPADSAHLFVHVLAGGEVLAQQDNLPDPLRPTDSWPPRSTIQTSWTIEGVSSPVTIRLGLYDVFSSERWAITSSPTLTVTDNYVEMPCS